MLVVDSQKHKFIILSSPYRVVPNEKLSGVNFYYYLVGVYNYDTNELGYLKLSKSCFNLLKEAVLYFAACKYDDINNIACVKFSECDFKITTHYVPDVLIYKHVSDKQTNYLKDLSSFKDDEFEGYHKLYEFIPYDEKVQLELKITLENKFLI